MKEKQIICFTRATLWAHTRGRHVWRQIKGNPSAVNRKIQKIQWPKEEEQKDKQQSIKHTHIIKDRVTRTPLISGVELMCFGRVSSSCSTSGTCRLTLVTNPVISNECGKDREVFTISGTYPYPWSFVTHIFHTGQPRHCSDRETFEMMSST